jgi:hypothetical protein
MYLLFIFPTKVMEKTESSCKWRKKEPALGMKIGDKISKVLIMKELIQTKESLLSGEGRISLQRFFPFLKG